MFIIFATSSCLVFLSLLWIDVKVNNSNNIVKGLATNPSPATPISREHSMQADNRRPSVSLPFLRQV